MTVHMIRLCVGCDTIDDLLAWHADRAGPWTLHTRMTPKRADDMLDGGSLYRIFKGVILCRQQILDIRRVGEGAAARCEMALSPEIIKVEPTPRRPFQGWRYLDPKDAPADLAQGGEAGIPDDLARQLRDAGVW